MVSINPVVLPIGKKKQFKYVQPQFSQKSKIVGKSTKISIYLKEVQGSSFVHKVNQQW